MTGRQACHRVQERERILALPRLFAPLHWPLPPLWESWISAVSISPELNSFLLSMCIDAPELLWLEQESQTSLCPYY